MNVLILTPDAVGSTLLQRFITIYMQFYNFDRPVINLHELTNGLERYWSSDFNQEIVSKRHGSVWGYHQSLREITELLASVDHYKVSRLAHYHLRRRQDPQSHQLPFYRYLDDNFFVIACRRQNVFEHALSWSLNRITKKLNVYGIGEKCNAFWDLYVNPVDVDIMVFGQCLDNYKDYIQWSNDHFSIASYFQYEQHVPDLEQFILGLPMFANRGHRITWQDKFGLDLHEWNRVHNLRADIGTIALDHPERLSLIKPTGNTVLDYQRFSLPEWPAIQSQADFANLPAPIQQAFQQRQNEYYDVTSQLPADQQQYLSERVERYDRAMGMIKQMQQLDILISPPPIKKQTLREKRHIIKNFRQCMDFYNEWIQANPEVGSVFTQDDMEQQDQTEHKHWHSVSVDLAQSPRQDFVRLTNQNDVHPGPNQLDDKGSPTSMIA